MRFNYLVVVGASAGGIEALRTLVGALPPEFPAPICVVTHTSPESPGVLDAILSRAGPLPAINVRDANRLEPGRIYVAPPDYHLLVEPGRVRVTKGPRENGFRPAIDPLFRSAAQVYGPRTIGIILTGNLDDGTAGLWAVKQLGGVAIVQDPADASFPEMPTNAMQHAKVDHVVPIAALAPLLVRLTTQAAPEEPAEAVPEHLEVEVKISGENNPYEAGLEKLGTPSSYACPDCHGVLLQLREGERVRFRCHTGHAYSIVSLLAAVGEGIEDAMWNAIRSLEEAALLMERIAEHMRTSHGAAGAANLVERGDETRRQADEIRKLVMQREPLPTPDN